MKTMFKSCENEKNKIDAGHDIELQDTSNLTYLADDFFCYLKRL